MSDELLFKRPEFQALPKGEKEAAVALASPLWRLNNLYKIQDAQGHCIQFKLNWAQDHFIKNLHYFNVILKARQLGFSSFILIYMLDAALFNPNHSCGVIAQGLVEAADLFDNKVKFAYENLPQQIKDLRPLVADSARKLEFNNGSSITVGTSLRGGTFQKLHISEYGKIAARHPEKAKEIKTGALNTVHAGQQIFVESTAEGMAGEFFDLVKLARRLDDEGKELSLLDPKFHFYPWFENPDYALTGLDARTAVLTQEFLTYFTDLEKDYDIKLTYEQKAWYMKKAQIMGEDMKREFPSTPDEAFSASLEGAYFSRQMQFLRRNKQICRVPWEPKSLVHTFWDLGNYDYTAIWFMQHVGREYRFIRYLQASGSDLSHYAQELRSFDYVYGYHHLPHDGARRQLGLKNQSIREMLESLGVRPVVVIPRTNDVRQDIEMKCKPMLPRCWFDEQNCAEGIVCLDSYRKQWDDRLAVWKEEPRHDESSHGADAYRTFAVGYDPARSLNIGIDETLDDESSFPQATGNRISGY